MKLTGFKALSADVESKRVLKIHFDHEVQDADRQALVDTINSQNQIERLREQIASAESAMQKMIQVAAKADAEIARLTAEKSGWDAQFERLLNRAVKAEQEIARLTAEKSGWDAQFERLLNRAVKAEQEIERLLTLLDEIAAMGPADEEWDADTLESAVALAKKARANEQRGNDGEAG